MDIDLDDTHTDYTHPRTRPVPAGCTESEGDWRRRLQHDTPGGHLLAHNTMTQTLASGRPIHLMHTTSALDAIRASGQLYASSGCLLAALYCAPLAETPVGLRPHNLGAYLLQTKPHTQTLVIEITPTAPAPAKGIDYLRLGPSTCTPTSTTAASSPRPRTSNYATEHCTRSVTPPLSSTRSWPTPPDAGQRRARSWTSSPLPSQAFRSWATCTSRCSPST